jgi:hypothetical protein
MVRLPLALSVAEWYFPFSLTGAMLLQTWHSLGTVTLQFIYDLSPLLMRVATL